MIFVFGSNLAGIHGAGAAKDALFEHGATAGQGIGRSGNSYAIPTKGHAIRTLPLEEVADYIHEFIKYARSNPNEIFQVTQIGCGLAGFTSPEIAPLFYNAPDNCCFDSSWEKWLPGKKFWGTY